MNEDSRFFLDLSKTQPSPITNDCVHLGTAQNTHGEKLGVNNKFLLKNNKPWLMVMGEFHFSRYPRNEWENAVLEMKAGGIEIVATYIFWIHHEEEKGQWNWQDNRDIGYFASLCAKHQLYLFIRIGPWCHGEVRNGGHPDWIGHGLKLRQNHPVYMGYTKELYRQIHEQLKAFYFKDNGPIIGVQIENERTFNNSSGLEYMLALKKLAREIGIDVPYYTATGWQGYDNNQRELLPMWGAYPDAPWARGAEELVDNKRCFHFSPYLHESDIGNDLLASRPKLGKVEDFPFPFLNVENGAGTQCTHHRRPTFNMYDGASLIMAKIGSGANGIGYYVFHGGSNPIGKLSTLQESKASLYPNDLPVISYDFYAPIGEWGQLRPSYGKLKTIHYFLQDFGHILAEFPTVFPEKMPLNVNDPQTLRWVVRSNGQQGFVFLNEYQRHLEMDDIKDVQFHFHLHEKQELSFPERPITVPKDTIAILPFNLNFEKFQLVWATMQPLCLLNHKNNSPKTLVMIAIHGIDAEMVFSEKNIRNITGTNVEITKQGPSFKIHISHPGMEVNLKIEASDGKIYYVLVLTAEQGMNAWKIPHKGEDLLIVSNSKLIFSNESIKFQSIGYAHINFSIYPSNSPCQILQGPTMAKKSEGIFANYQIDVPEKTTTLHWEEDTKLSLKLKKSKAKTRLIPFSPITFYPLYDTVLARVAGAHYWKVKLPQDLFDDVSNIFLNIDYDGDSLAAYLGGKLIADNFFAGEPMTIGLKRFESSISGNELILLVTPMKDLTKIYLEKEVKERFSSKNLSAKIISIDAVPVYGAEVKIQ